MGDAIGAPAASAPSGSAPPRSTTIRATATTEKLLGMFTLMNSSEFVVDNWEKKTCNEARTGQVWAVKKLRELISFEAAQFGSVWANKVPAENVRVWPFDARRGGIRASAHFRADFEGVGPRRAEKDG